MVVGTRGREAREVVNVDAVANRLPSARWALEMVAARQAYDEEDAGPAHARAASGPDGWEYDDAIESALDKIRALEREQKSRDEPDVPTTEVGGKHA